MRHSRTTLARVEHPRRGIALLLCGWALALLVGRSADAGAADVAPYDNTLCTLAQRMLLNVEGEAAPLPFRIEVLRGEGNGFHTIQMDVDAASRTVTIATTTVAANVDGQSMPGYVACKMVDRDRVNDVLGLALTGPERSCRDVNEFTYQQALESLGTEERARYEATRRPLRFTADSLLATGGEWLPAAADDFVHMSGTEASAGAGLDISAPSVRVPWDGTQRSFFQGTRHCKLITLAAMRHWMLAGAASADTVLFARSKPACTAPSATTSKVGSCLFYFAPASARFCEDYSGSEWTSASARAECGKRHASAEALRQAANRYAGAGGVFSDKACAERDDAGLLAGTCVFHCNRPDEALWHPLAGAVGPPAGGSMMSRACDLFVK